MVLGWDGRLPFFDLMTVMVPACQALTAEIVKTIRDIIALNPLYRSVSAGLRRTGTVSDSCLTPVHHTAHCQSYLSLKPEYV
jgi:hypothetical protein